METASMATASHAAASPAGSGGAAAMPFSAAAAAAAAAADESGGCSAFGACWSLAKAYKCINEAGCSTTAHPPVHIEADSGLDPSELTVLGARAALENNARSAVAVQRSRKRNADDSRNTLVGWVVL